MSSTLLLLAGALLLFVSILDLLWTTLAAASARGPLTMRLTSGAWRLLPKRGALRNTLLRTSGPAILVLTGMTWIVLLWAAWSLVFLSFPDSVVRAGATPTDAWDKIYFTGYALFTLGNGDLRPVGAPWQIATVAMAGSGLVLVTLTISYVVPVLGAAVTKRKLAAEISAFGTSPQAVLLTAWDGAGWTHLVDHLTRLGPTIAHIGEAHLAYPVLHYFTAPDADRSTPPTLAVLDETLTILMYGVEEGSRPDPRSLLPLRASVANLLETLEQSFITPADETPPPPDLDPLARAGIEVVDDDAFASRLVEVGERRRRLAGLLAHHGWKWQDVMAHRRADDLDRVARAPGR